MTFRLTLAAMALAAFCVSAFAQTAPDPRITPQTINALQAMLALRDAQMKAMEEDFRKRENDWSVYSAPLWQPPKSAKPKKD